jgi:hypothetical protein
MKNPNNEQKLATGLRRLYWMNRTGMAFIWIWSAWVSWFMYPQAESLEWLRRLGLVDHTQFWLAASCALDLVMGIVTLALPSKMLWRVQMMLVVFYSVAIMYGLPEFLLHPFGPVIKNIAVLGCLYFLMIFEELITKDQICAQLQSH